MNLLRLKNNSGQTVLELAFFSVWLFGFLVLTAYLSKVFDVSQKQAMLIRSQAFMELGNFSDYGLAKHGEDNVKDAKSQVSFTLGQNSGASRVDLKKNDTFKTATSGELILDISTSRNSDKYWDNYGFPKEKTTIGWFADGSNTPVVQMILHQNLAIASNRSIKINSSAPSSATTGLFSGSLHITDLQKISEFSQTAAKGTGLVDNLQALRDASKQLVKDDPSLSDEAAKLEKSINAADGLTDGAQAGAISSAISMAAAGVMAGISQAANAAKGADAASTVGKTGGEVATKTSTSGLNSLAKTFSSPTTWAKNAVQGTALEAPLSVVLSPITTLTDGFASLAAGLDSGGWLGSATGTGTFGSTYGSGGVFGANGALTGLSQIGRGVEMDVGFAGVNIQGLNTASQAAGIPGALLGGVSGFEGEIHNVNPYTGMGNYVGAVTSILSPLTSLVSMVAPNLAVPLSYVNQGLAVAGGISAAVNGVAQFSSTDESKKNVPQILKDVGAFTMGVGGLYSGVAALTKKGDPMIGAYISMAGGALYATGTVAQMAEDMKTKGVSLWNPVNYVTQTAKDNYYNAGNYLTGFSKNMGVATNTITHSMADIFTPSQKITDPNAKIFGNSMSDLYKTAADTTDNFLGGINKNDLSKGNINRAGADMSNLQAALVVNMTYHDVDPAEVAQTKTNFDTVNKTIANLSAFKSGTAPLDSQLLAAGNLAIANLNESVSNYLQQNPNLKEDDSEINKYANQEVEAMLSSKANSQKTLELTAIQNGQTQDDVANLQKDLITKGGFSGAWANVTAHTTGANAALKAELAQQQRIKDLVTLANAKKNIDQKISDAKIAVRATEISEKISMFAPIATNDPITVQQNAAKLVSILRAAESDKIYSDDMRARMSVQADKLEAIASGSRAIISQRQWLKDATTAVNNANAQMKSMEANAQAEADAAQCEMTGGC